MNTEGLRWEGCKEDGVDPKKRRWLVFISFDMLRDRGAESATGNDRRWSNCKTKRGKRRGANAQRRIMASRSGPTEIHLAGTPAAVSMRATCSRAGRGRSAKSRTAVISSVHPF